MLLLLLLTGPLTTFPDFHLLQPLLEMQLLRFRPWELEDNFLPPRPSPALMNCAVSEHSEIFRELLAKCRILVSLGDNSASVESRLSGRTDTSAERLSSVACGRRTRG